MAKKGRGSNNKGRTPIRNAALLRGQKTEIIKENGKEDYRASIRKEQADGKTMKALTNTTIKEIRSEKESPNTPQTSHTAQHASRNVGKENFIKKIIAEKNTPSPKVKEQKAVGKVKSKKQMETPPKNELVLRLKASTSLSAPEKIQQNLKKDFGQQKGASRLTDSLKQGQNVKKASPAKKPPTPGR